MRKVNQAMRFTVVTLVALLTTTSTTVQAIFKRKRSERSEKKTQIMQDTQSSIRGRSDRPERDRRTFVTDAFAAARQRENEFARARTKRRTTEEFDLSLRPGNKKFERKLEKRRRAEEKAEYRMEAAFARVKRERKQAPKRERFKGDDKDYEPWLKSQLADLTPNQRVKRAKKLLKDIDSEEKSLATQRAVAERYLMSARESRDNKVPWAKYTETPAKAPPKATQQVVDPEPAVKKKKVTRDEKQATRREELDTVNKQLEDAKARMITAESSDDPLYKIQRKEIQKELGQLRKKQGKLQKSLKIKTKQPKPKKKKRTKQDRLDDLEATSRVASRRLEEKQSPIRKELSDVEKNIEDAQARLITAESSDDQIYKVQRKPLRKEIQELKKQQKDLQKSLDAVGQEEKDQLRKYTQQIVRLQEE